MCRYDHWRLAATQIAAWCLGSVLSDHIGISRHPLRAVLQHQVAADGFELLAYGAELSAVEVTALDLGHLPLTQADALGELLLRRTECLTQSRSW